MTILKFGQRVRNRRSELGYSVPELAERAKIDKTVIYSLEAGESKDINTLTFVKLMKALRWSPEEAVDAYNGKESITDSIQKDRVFQAVIDFLKNLERIGVFK